MKKVKYGLILSVACISFLLGGCSSNGQKATKEGALTIVAHVTVKSEYKEDVLKAFQDVVNGTRKEPGNVSYVLHEHVDNPLKFTFVEVWASQEAIDSHNASDHFQKFAQAIDGKAGLEVYTMKVKY